jgi:predicted house-cleaning noncanonical NTP pyrophosphatase (MazG superfamily)
MSHILHGFTDPNYLEALIAKAETQLREAENEEDRQRFAAYLDVLKGWKEKIGASQDDCSPGESESK